MNNQSKQQIKELTARRIALAGSQNKYARSLDVSPATLSYLMNDEWDKISAEMWRRFAQACGFKDESWQIVHTTSFKLMMSLLADAQTYSNTYALVAGAGTGKSEITRYYAGINANVYRVECAEYFNKKSFLSELLKAMGRNNQGFTVYEMMAMIQDELLKVENPLIVLDEADKLKDEVLYFFITLYNKLEDKCGLLMCSTEFLRTRVNKGVRMNKKGYSELFSRIGRRFVEFPAPDATDISLVCQANGVEVDKDVANIVRESDNDLRRVKRLIHAYKRRAGKEVAHG